MQIFKWNEILEALEKGSQIPYFAPGTGISVGSFDGLHQGHRKLLSSLVQGCKENQLIPGVLTFSRPLPSIKHSGDYMGDLSTLAQRVELFASLGIDFVILVDFDDSFASMMGSDFLKILANVCNMNLLAEGIDFRCGYKGATDTQAIRYWANENNVDCIFVDPVYYKEGTEEEERISSSYIRSMIQKGFFTTASELLERPYQLDLYSFRQSGYITQILPPDGIYRTLSEKGESVRLEIINRGIKSLPECNRLNF
ncbi:MAG: FAD synthetase family protein [Treponema sp.]|nr:FAD synthetase family protein [Treponema sp.]